MTKVSMTMTVWIITSTLKRISSRVVNRTKKKKYKTRVMMKQPFVLALRNRVVKIVTMFHNAITKMTTTTTKTKTMYMTRTMTKSYSFI